MLNVTGIRVSARACKGDLKRPLRTIDRSGRFHHGHLTDPDKEPTAAIACQKVSTGSHRVTPVDTSSGQEEQIAVIP